MNFLRVLLRGRDQFVVIVGLNYDSAVAFDKFVHIEPS